MNWGWGGTTTSPPSFSAKISAMVGLWATTPPVSTTSPSRRIHLHHPVDDRGEGASHETRHRLAPAEVGEDLGLGEDGAEAVQPHRLVGAARQALELVQLDVESQRDLLEKGAGAGRALAVHLEIDPAPAVVEADDLVVLARRCRRW